MEGINNLQFSEDTPITFVRTRHKYDSYTDFFRLVELAEFPTIYVDEVDVSQHGVFIVAPMNGEWRPHIDNQEGRIRNAHLVLWNLERPSGSSGSIGYYGEANRDLIYNRHVDEVWVSDRRLADETTLRYVTLGSHKDLGAVGSIEEKHYSLVHMSYVVPRRETILKEFVDKRMAPNAWPPQRHNILKKSKFAVNIHQDQHPFQEPLRFALFAAYGLPIISETILDSFPYSEETMVFSIYDHMVTNIKNILGDEDYNHYYQMGIKARELMTETYEFGKMVKEAIYNSVDKWR